jgi:DNA-binding transcriptional regulator GbsR (MarR family)
MATEIEEIERKIYASFGEVASSIGYSSIHGQIIGALLVKGRPLSLQEAASATGYSASMVSISLDLLELVGMIRKFKKASDRKLYIELSGDLLESLKKAIVMRVEKSVTNSLRDFQESRKTLKSLKSVDKERVLKTLDVLESQVRRLDTYAKLLSGIRLPRTNTRD